MIHIFGYNSPHGRSDARSILSAEVQIPDGAGGWVTVGALPALPRPSLIEGEGGVNLRPNSSPSYLVPKRFETAQMLSVGWLGFEATSVRLAHLTNHARDNYGSSYGACEVIFLEEDTSASLQVLAI